MRPKKGRLNENDTKTDPRRAWQQTQEYHSKIIITILKKKKNQQAGLIIFTMIPLNSGNNFLIKTYFLNAF